MASAQAPLQTRDSRETALIVRTRSGADLRTTEFGSSAIPPPWQRGTTEGWAPAVARRVTAREATGIAAVMRAIRLKAETLAAFRLCIETFDRQSGIWVPAQNAWQTGLFANPCADYTGFDWVSDEQAMLDGFGNGFALKTKGRVGRVTQVLELIPLDPDGVRIRRKDGMKVFDVRSDLWGNRIKTLTAQDVLHLRGFTINGAFSGLSPAMHHAAAHGYALALEEFSGRYFSNDTTVGLVMEVPGNLSLRNAQRQLAIWEMSRAGGQNAHRPALVYNGTKLNRLGLGLRDSQYIEARNWTVQEVARMYGVPASLLEVDQATTGTQRLTAEQKALEFLAFGFFQTMRRFEVCLENDPDLNVQGSGLRVRFETEGLIRVDAATSANIDHARIQDGTRMRDELRARDGLPPLPPLPENPEESPGKVVPLFPVGAGELGAGIPDATKGTQSTGAGTGADEEVNP